MEAEFRNDATSIGGHVSDEDNAQHRGWPHVAEASNAKLAD